MGAIAEMAATGSAAEQKVRLLLAISPASPAAARQVLSLVRGLDRDQFDLSLACPRDAPLAEEAGSLALEVFPAAIPPTPSPVKAMSAALALSRAIARGGFHLVHAHSFAASLAAGLAREFTAWPVLICSIHEPLTRPPRMRPAVHRWALRMIARKADRIITTCRTLRAAFDGVRGAEDNLVTIPDGVDLEQPRDPADRAQARAAMGVADDAPVIGVLGGVPHEKDMVEFRHVMERLQSRLPQVTFVCVAEQGASAAEPAHAEGLSVACPSTRASIDAFNLLVMLPPYERFPLQAVQAMAAARPVCGYAVGALPEVVADGETGLLAPDGDPDALASALETLLADPQRARAMGDAGRERARREFSLPVMIEAIQDLYADLVRSRIVEGRRP